MSSFNPVSFTVTFPLLILLLFLTTMHIVHTSPAAAPRPLRKPGKHDVGHLPGTWSRDRRGTSLAPPPNAAQHERQRFACCSHISPQDTCHVMLPHTHPPPRLSGAFTWTPTTAARRVLLFALAGGRRLPPAAPSANSVQPLFSRQPVMSPVHLQRAVCACAHVACDCITTVGGASLLCPLLVRQDQRKQKTDADVLISMIHARPPC